MNAKHAGTLATLSLLSGPAFAADSDVTGTWKAKIDGQMGMATEIVIVLQQDGSDLTGTLAAGQMPPTPILHGKNWGDVITFRLPYTPAPVMGMGGMGRGGMGGGMGGGMPMGGGMGGGAPMAGGMAPGRGMGAMGPMPGQSSTIYYLGTISKASADRIEFESSVPGQPGAAPTITVFHAKR